MVEAFELARDDLSPMRSTRWISSDIASWVGFLCRSRLTTTGLIADLAECPRFGAAESVDSIEGVLYIVQTLLADNEIDNSL